MAFSGFSRKLIIHRTPISSLKTFIPSKKNIPTTVSSPLFSPPIATSSPPTRLFSSSLSRSRGALGCLQSLIPFHTAVSDARLTSCLSSSSPGCRSLSQGTLCRTSPGL